MFLAFASIYDSVNGSVVDQDSKHVRIYTKDSQLRDFDRSSEPLSRMLYFVARYPLCSAFAQLLMLLTTQRGYDSRTPA